MKINPKITLELVVAAVERRNSTLDNPGFCIACGLEADGCDPDTREGECESCGSRRVYGADELMMMMF